MLWTIEWRSLTRGLPARSEGKRFALSANAPLGAKDAPKMGTQISAGSRPGPLTAQLQTQLPVLVGWMEQEPRVTGGPTDLMQAA